MTGDCCEEGAGETDASTGAIGWFTDQAYNAILLAEDEARMLGQPRVRARSMAARTPPGPGPIPPVFERFSREAHRTVKGAVESARSLENQYVAPTHLLLGLFGGEDGVVASVRPRHQRHFDAATGRAAELMADHSRAARRMAQDVADRRARVSTAPTGIFSAPARHLVAEDVLSVAHRLDHRIVGTGHLFLAILENPDETTAEILEALPDAQQIAGEVTEALPGDEHT